MYRSSPAAKLPTWQRASTAPAYRRTPLSRRNRFLIIIAIVLLAWYHYSGSSTSDGPTEAFIHSETPRAYPRRQPPATPVQPAEPEQPDEQEAILHDTISPEEVAVVKQLVPIVRERAEDLIDPLTPPSKVLSPEYVEDDTAPKQALLNHKRKPISGQGNGVSEALDHERPDPVKQASEKMIEQHLNPAPKYEGSAPFIQPQSNDGPRKFPPYDDYTALDEKAEGLPDIVHIPFEASVADVTLEGWEDQWFADAELDIPRWGNISETKIDFVYTCKIFLCTIHPSHNANMQRGQWFGYSFSGNDLSVRGEQHLE